MTKGHGSKLGRKQELAIANLLTEATIELAAQKTGVSHHTLKLWLTDPAFSHAFKAARRQLVDDAVRQL